ncbi:transglutaminase family protein [Formosa sp. L2A11]|uniref:transglutaminase-like domain-containing protein n=1 Tax=Formosa sp. L2A11 TaxID=2686363 RepID=UPI00131B40DD|nr:transglutaminase family protein [Formosa sp. L2A11]
MYNYTIKYSCVNTYENPVFESFWQYIVTPQNNSTQELSSGVFSVSNDAVIEKSINGYNFETARIHTKKPFESLTFEAVFKLTKTKDNPLKIDPKYKIEDGYKALKELDFQVDYEAFLNTTELTTLPKEQVSLFDFDTSKSILDNLKRLNNWVHKYIVFKAGETTTETLLETVIEKKKGLSPDFTHLLCAIARVNKIPARYVSGYLHQGDGLLGDSQMCAWVEVLVPNLGWIGLDPVNNLLTDHNYIKVAHGRDYKDCEPLKQLLFSYGEKTSKCVVEVTYEQ